MQKVGSMLTWSELLAAHKGLRLRKCVTCGSFRNMVRIVDSKYDLYDYRVRVCFACEFELMDETQTYRELRR